MRFIVGFCLGLWLTIVAVAFALKVDSDGISATLESVLLTLFAVFGAYCASWLFGWFYKWLKGA